MGQNCFVKANQFVSFQQSFSLAYYTNIFVNRECGDFIPKGIFRMPNRSRLVE